MCDKNSQSNTAGASVRYDAALGLKEKTSTSIQYTPLLVKMMLDLYDNHDYRAYLLYGQSLSKAQAGVVELLKHAEIITPAPSSPVLGAAPMWKVDEDALRAYVNRVCNIPLPMKHWVMP